MDLDKIWYWGGRSYTLSGNVKFETSKIKHNLHGDQIELYYLHEKFRRTFFFRGSTVFEGHWPPHM
jgi:hypothetical protein